MKRKIWLLIMITLVFVAALVAALFLPRFFSSPASPSTLSPGSLVSPSQAALTTGWGDLPTVTPPGPGEPTLPPEALAMRTAPTATPSPIPPSPFPTQTPAPTPTPVPATGHDDVPMVKVPAGEFLMGNTREDIRRFLSEWYQSYGLSFQPDTFLNEVPLFSAYLETFYIDQVEVTNSHYRECIAAGYCPSVNPSNYSQAGQVQGYASQIAFNEYPAFTSWFGARSYCEWVGKRLPTEAEWEKAARGTDGRQYPWGNEWDGAYVERELMPVGSHPQATSPYGVLDMVGNAPEWVLDRYDLYPGTELVAPGLQYLWFEGPLEEIRVVRGNWGNYLEMRLAARTTDRLDRGVAGFRCVRGQEPTSLAQATRDILLPTGVPTLVPAPVPDLANMAYVPAGWFIMGATETQIQNSPDKVFREDETPAHVVYLDAYFIDRTEVTTVDFVAFLNTMNETIDASPKELCGGDICASWGNDTVNYIMRQNGRFTVDDPRHENYPVTGVSWQGAQAYCRWLSKRLPTEAEWEKAGRGTDGRLFPWGNDWRSDLVDIGSTERRREVGSALENASPYGVLDMLGGTYEYTADYYTEDYYDQSAAFNPTGPEWSPFVVVRGKGTSESENSITVRERDTGGASPEIGFRCVYWPGS